MVYQMVHLKVHHRGLRMPERDDYLKKLAPLVIRPEWDMFMVYITTQLNNERDNLEFCSADSLKSVQAKISVYRDLLTIKETISRLLK